MFGSAQNIEQSQRMPDASPTQFLTFGHTIAGNRSPGK